MMLLRPILTGFFVFLSFSAWADSSPSEATPTLRTTVVTYPIEYNLRLPEFLSKVENYVKDSAAEGAQLVVLPELLSFDTVRLTGESMAAQGRQIARDISPAYLEALQRWSREYDIAIFGGSTPWVLEGSASTIVNRAFLVFQDGQLISQDKNYLTPDEAQDYGWHGVQDSVAVHDTPLGRIVILVCYDVEFPLISQKIAASQPEILIVPSMTSPQGFGRVRVTSQARAVEHHAYVIVSGVVDALNSSRDHYTGNSAIFEPYDIGYTGTLAEGSFDKEGRISATLDLQKLRRSKRSSGFYPGRDQSLTPTHFFRSMNTNRPSSPISTGDSDSSAESSTKP
jgi:predicted amidohydrolase